MSATDISLIDGTLILNGVEITGWGDSETALEFPNQDIASIRRGADGGMVSGKTGNFGGPVNMTLLSNSPGYKFLMGVKQAQQLGGAVEFQGFFRHENFGFTATLVGGTLTNAPTGTTMGNAAPPSGTFTIEFTRIDTDYLLS